MTVSTATITPYRKGPEAEAMEPRTPEEGEKWAYPSSQAGAVDLWLTSWCYRPSGLFHQVLFSYLQMSLTCISTPPAAHIYMYTPSVHLWRCPSQALRTRWWIKWRRTSCSLKVVPSLFPLLIDAYRASMCAASIAVHGQPRTADLYMEHQQGGRAGLWGQTLWCTWKYRGELSGCCSGHLRCPPHHH